MEKHSPGGNEVDCQILGRSMHNYKRNAWTPTPNHPLILQYRLREAANITIKIKPVRKNLAWEALLLGDQ